MMWADNSPQLKHSMFFKMSLYSLQWLEQTYRNTSFHVWFPWVVDILLHTVRFCFAKSLCKAPDDSCWWPTRGRSPVLLPKLWVLMFSYVFGIWKHYESMASSVFFSALHVHIPQALHLPRVRFKWCHMGLWSQYQEHRPCRCVCPKGFALSLRAVAKSQGSCTRNLLMLGPQ